MITYAVILIVLSVLLFVVEVFVPSGGIIGFFAGLALIGGIVCLFWVNTNAGLAALLIAMIVTPFAIAFAVKVFPHTPIGRRLMLSSSQKAGAPDYDPNMKNAENELVGKSGVAVGELRPVGTCKIDGRRIECLAESGLIDAGTEVEVTSVQGMHVKVRAARKG